ncbi:Ecdysteroid kinase-domain-containing protein [Dactylonectria estremocensis]|uniref:Ecdysteroid kinase-domain-containing protein n=1 Tax=Dactylonectria estremocensis TaxID=1079267 RepID=A0A9P9ETS4_9HYPO|nr:Ecdysteroid kinase-domain-containing protein [Dactylonectria estremocensis]
MPSRIKPKRVAEVMLASIGLDLVSMTELQSLWAGYGHICAVKAHASDKETAARVASLCGEPDAAAAGSTFHLILKLISPPSSNGATSDEGHLRKMLSYDVEQYFYNEVTPSLDQNVAVAKCLVSTRTLAEEELQGLTATIMTDLRPKFPVAGEKRSILDPRQVHAALEWLANFHGSSWKMLPDDLNAFVLPPLEEMQRRRTLPDTSGQKLWLNGGYTYLATRRSEYASLAADSYSEWNEAFCGSSKDSSQSIADMAAAFLTPRGRPFETYIHGDVKSENLFTTKMGDKVAFFDFQYVGLGLGVCDLAKLFTCSVPTKMLATGLIPDELAMQDGERNLLEHYRETLLSRRPPGSDIDYPVDLFIRHWETALVDWCRFQASWGFWGNTEWLEARVRSILKDVGWRDWLQKEVSGLSR